MEVVTQNFSPLVRCLSRQKPVRRLSLTAEGCRQPPLVLLISALSVLWLSACSSSPQQENQATHIGWHCEGEPGTSSWRCSQRSMRSGRVVGKAVGNPGEAEVQVARSKTEASRAPIITGKRRQLSWREQLPGLDGTGVVEEPEGDSRQSRATIESRSEPAPQPEPAFEMWEDRSRSEASENRRHSGEILSPPHGTAPASTKKGVDPKAASPVDPLRPTVGDYTVQLAAFSREVDAQKFIAGAQWRAVTLEVSQFVRAGKPLFVVTFGRFASLREALTAWSVQDPDGGQDIWVRKVRK